MHCLIIHLWFLPIRALSAATADTIPRIKRPSLLVTIDGHSSICSPGCLAQNPRPRLLPWLSSSCPLSVYLRLCPFRHEKSPIQQRGANHGFANAFVTQAASRATAGSTVPAHSIQIPGKGKYHQMFQSHLILDRPPTQVDGTFSST